MNPAKKSVPLRNASPAKATPHKAAIEAFALAESRYAKDDPVEGVVVGARPSSHPRTRNLPDGREDAGRNAKDAGVAAPGAVDLHSDGQTRG